MAFFLPMLPIPRASHHRIAPAGTERLAAVPLTLAVVARRPVDGGAKGAVVHTRDRLQDDLRTTPSFLNTTVDPARAKLRHQAGPRGVESNDSLHPMTLIYRDLYGLRMSSFDTY